MIIITIDADINYLCGYDNDIIRRASALFPLKLKEHRHLSQAAINDIVEGCQGIFINARDYMLAAMKAKLAEIGAVDEEKASEIATSLKMIAQPFDGIETFYKQEKYFVEELGYVVRIHNTYVYIIICNILILNDHEVCINNNIIAIHVS